MNEIQSEVAPIFQCEQLKGATREQQLALLGSLAMELAAAVRSENKKDAWNTLNAVSLIGHPLDCDAFNALYKAIAIYTASVYNTNEFYYQEWLKKHVAQLIPGAKITHRKNDLHNIPDAWVDICGEVGPVEVKLAEFDEKALRQLKRYIKVYNAPFGIAVARCLSVKLPENIKFIGLDEIDELEGR